MTENTANKFHAAALKGDGQFAIAYALLVLADAHNNLTKELCSGSAHDPGALENVGIELGAIAKAIKNRD